MDHKNLNILTKKVYVQKVLASKDNKYKYFFLTYLLNTICVQFFFTIYININNIRINICTLKQIID
jgi:hypothetical protein